MKTCLTCSAAADAEAHTCANCGEASWSEPFTTADAVAESAKRDAHAMPAPPADHHGHKRGRR